MEKYLYSEKFGKNLRIRKNSERKKAVGKKVKSRNFSAEFGRSGNPVDNDKAMLDVSGNPVDNDKATLDVILSR